jgi:hypothetical protein
VSDAARYRVDQPIASRAQWQGVLAARYGRRTSLDRHMVAHLVLLDPLVDKRVRRASGETLCGRVGADHMAGYASDNEARCPRCLELLAKHGGRLRVVEERGDE